ncbi:uncharacterized protein TRAVEDRAFT_57745 [Trametes versicolor FP-101664 SS1]|uniref:uncharacterized protein n=1 Tax=Trametes versicolor (strain FP-101664) TaxID=717944 RepID=UPI0004623AE5|nr:uncharacterized protein TRAVEDRAFT_57745 [Trametes versicolor FP-101664 SS1]EIW60524.1 hypothetical protein TRAVEDRAFT_57745 [Trametes versicolor FP-101664 SS1]
MSSRLASFRGPSTPNASPVARQTTTPLSPSRYSELPHHRTLRSQLLELRNVAYEWDERVSGQGLKAASSLVDARTELDNELAVLSDGKQPAYPIVLEKLRFMETCIEDLHEVIKRLDKLFQKMVKIIKSLEVLLHEVHKTKGWRFVEEPLWVTWSLEKFVTKLPYILKPYRRSLETHIDLVEQLRPHDVTFEESRQIIALWQAQPHLALGGWDAVWEDICAVEVDRWNAPR